MRHAIPILVAVSTLLAADDPKADALKTEQDRHQGTWLVTSFVREGKEAPEAITRTIVRVMEGDHVIWKRDGKSFAGTRVELDPTKEPHAIDVIPDGGRDREKRVPGIYKLDGDDLTICMADPGGDRPRTFDAGEGSKRTLMTFRREKKKD